MSFHNQTTRQLGIGLLLISACSFAYALTAANVVAQEKKFAHEFYHDFRGKPLPNEIQVVGKPENDFIREEPAGFRVTLPNTWIHAFGGVGCKTNFTLQGDFEATGTFEILHADEPPKGFGVGASLRVQTGGPEPKGATFARVVRAGGNQILVWDHGPLQDKKFAAGVAKCSDKLLRLRLKRTGTTLHYQWAPGLIGDDFVEVRAEKNFGADDGVAIRMSPFTGKEPRNVDVRFVDLRIQSGGLVDANAKQPPQAAPAANNLQPNPAGDAPRSRSSLLIALAIGLGLTVLAILAAAVAIVMKRKRANVEQPEADAMAESEYVSFGCPACSKNLKAKAASIGKKIKCIKCGHATVVPAAEAR